MRARSTIPLRGLAGFVALLGLPSGLASAAPPRLATSIATRGSTGAGVVISAVYYDGYAPGDADEAVQLWNVGTEPLDLSGWSVDDGEGSAAFPTGTMLPAGQHRWLARDGAAFAVSFGAPPEWSWAPGTDLATRNGGPSLANRGDDVRLLDAQGVAVDTVVYGEAPSAAGWIGPAVQPYGTPAMGRAHQVLYRKLEPSTGRPAPDTNTAGDWASDPDDPVAGRRVRYPGWSLEGRTLPEELQGTGHLEVAVAPDASYLLLERQISAARSTLDLMAYNFDQPELADALAAKAAEGVRVRVLLDGAPAGGFDLDARWCAARVAAAGGAVSWLDDAGPVGARYKSAHAKILVRDQAWIVMATENPSQGSVPHDDLADGTAGRRGVLLATDVPSVVAWAADLFARDSDATHADVRPYQARDPARGAPPADYTPAGSGGGAGYAPVAAEPLRLAGAYSFDAITAPENAVTPEAGLYRMLARAGPGDQVAVWQLSEPWEWGVGADAGRTGNPRVAAYVAAARRGARVRILLDGFFDDTRAAGSNHRTARALNALARDEGLPLEARLGNPTGKGIHAKVILVTQGAEAWAHIGSLNGTEVSNKANREAALQVRSIEVVAYLLNVFEHDWGASRYGERFLPALSRGWPASSSHRGVH